MANELITLDPTQAVEFTPLGEADAVKITVKLVRDVIAAPTKSGVQPTDQDIYKFMMLCKARKLNPWVGDAYLLGYDSNAGPQFSLITSAQALLKRAESSPQFAGLQSGVLVKSQGGELVEREGDYVDADETLVGGWARAYRHDRRVAFFDSLNLGVFNTKRSRWAKDPAGMIVKCAESSVLRQAFPNEVGQLYTRDEMEHVQQAEPAKLTSTTALDAIVERETQQQQAPPEAAPEADQQPLAATGYDVGGFVNAVAAAKTRDEALAIYQGHAETVDAKLRDTLQKITQARLEEIEAELQAEASEAEAAEGAQ